MIIRKLKEEEFSQAIDLKISCWDEEVAGLAPNRLVKETELNFILNWVCSAEENKDIRIVYGAFEEDKLMGFAGASIAEEDGCEAAIELNYLFVYKKYRNQGVASKLILMLLEDFIPEGFDKLIVYSFHSAPSNLFYRNLGGNVFRQDIQGRLYRLLVDVFMFDAVKLRKTISRDIAVYNG